MTVRENPGDPPLTVSFDSQDADTMPEYLLVSVSSSDPALLPASAMVLEGSGVHRSLQLAPSPGALGTATVTVTVSDGCLETGRHLPARAYVRRAAAVRHRLQRFATGTIHRAGRVEATR